MEKREDCLDCNGKGSVMLFCNGEPVEKMFCPSCKGAGLVPESVAILQENAHAAYRAAIADAEDW